MGVYVEGVVIREAVLLVLPEVDRAYYRMLAAANTANARLNEAAGRHAGDLDLAAKRDSLYSRNEFERVLAYLRAARLPGIFRGVVYLQAGLYLDDGQQLQIADGALIAESTVYLGRGASLQITHSGSTRTLPALLVLDGGGLVTTLGARLRAHGLVYANRSIDIGRDARLDVVGAVLGADPEFSVRNFGGDAVVRYDPAVLGTPGLKVPDDAPVVAWVAAWEEVP
ncbi:MAG: hypothetical protein QN131_13240 [Armatimonadota bacterium]|nr:hypothetical protein [Armatimonadota bacterium]MDR7550882.1 hypothetical protein [Armatimonadota bacterium]